MEIMINVHLKSQIVLFKIDLIVWKSITTGLFELQAIRLK